MHKKTVPALILICIAMCLPLGREAFSQKMSDLSSDHLMMRLPKERALLGRGVITDLERFYQFINRSLDINLPRRIIVLVDWDLQESNTSYRNATVTVGMNQVTASNPQSFLLRESMREIARFGLFELSKGADRPDYTFLYEGMIEILVNEFNHTSRSLESAWAIAQFLDEMDLLGLDIQRSWKEFSGNHYSFRNAAPGITFLMTFRELKGRDKPERFFEALKRANLSRSLQDAFDGEPAELENIWLASVRERKIPDAITISAEEIPQLLETVRIPDRIAPGNDLKLRFLFKQGAGVLLPESVFVRDERTGTVYPGQGESEYIVGTVPVGEETASGEYSYTVTAIDESGNLRRWKGRYTVSSDQSPVGSGQ